MLIIMLHNYAAMFCFTRIKWHLENSEKYSNCQYFCNRHFYRSIQARFKEKNISVQEFSYLRCLTESYFSFTES